MLIIFITSVKNEHFEIYILKIIYKYFFIVCNFKYNTLSISQKYSIVKNRKRNKNKIIGKYVIP